MELNREQIVKALECCGSKGEFDCQKCPLTDVDGCSVDLMYDAFSLINELTEENEKIGIENFELVCELSRIKDSTVRKMQTEIEARCLKGGIYPAFVKSTIDQIAKEMVEGEK